MERKDSKEVHTEPTPLPQESTSPSKWQSYYTNGPLFILTGVFLLIIFMVVMFYESRLRYGGYGMMEYGPRMMHFQNISPSESWDGWEQENDRYWQDFDRRMGSMMERNNRMFRDVDTVPVPQNLNGKYSGTKIINGDSFTYSLEVGADSLTGSIAGTNSGSVESAIKNITNLGYTTKKTEGGGYSVTGNTGKAKELLNILGR